MEENLTVDRPCKKASLLAPSISASCVTPELSKLRKLLEFMYCCRVQNFASGDVERMPAEYKRTRVENSSSEV